MPRMLAQANRRLIWIPDGVVTDVSTLTVANLDPVDPNVYLSPLVSRQNFTLGPTGDESINDSPLDFDGNATAPGFTNYEAAMDFYRFVDTLEDVPWSTFTDKGIEGVLAFRIGPKADVAAAAAQEWQAYQVITGTQVPLQVSDSGGYEKFRQMFHVQDADLRVTVAV